MFRLNCALPTLALACLFAPSPRTASADALPPAAADTPPAASAPGITVTATALTPDRKDVRSYLLRGTLVPWSKNQPIYQGDVLRVKAFLAAPGDHSRVPTLYLDNQAYRSQEANAPLTWDIDTGEAGLGNHEVVVTLPDGRRKKSDSVARFSFFTIAPPASPAPAPSPSPAPAPSPSPAPAPSPSPVDPAPPTPPSTPEVEGQPAPEWQGKTGAKNAGVTLVKALSTDGSYNPNALLSSSSARLNIGTEPTYMEVLPASGGTGVTHYVFRIFRDGKSIFQSMTGKGCHCGPPNAAAETMLIRLVRSQDPFDPMHPDKPVSGLKDGDATLYVWGIKDGRLGAPAIAHLHVQTAH